MTAKTLVLQGIIKPAIATNMLNVLSVSLYNQNAKIKNEFASSKVDAGGSFNFKLNTHMLKRVFESGEQEVFFVIKKDGRELTSTMDKLVTKLDKDVIKVELKLSKTLTLSLEPVVAELPKLDINALLTSSGVKSTKLTAIQTKLKQSDLSTLDKLLTKQDKLTTGRTGLSNSQLKKFKSLVLLSTAAGSEKVGKKIVDSGITSLTHLGKMPLASAKARLSKALNKQDKISFIRAYQGARNIAINVADQIALDAQYGPIDPTVVKNLKIFPPRPPKRECNCSDCNAFSPYAYLLSLIEMLNDHWQLSVAELDEILNQDIGSLDCSSADITFAQIELAVEVLQESKLTKTLITNAEFKRNFEGIWALLLIDSENEVDKAIEQIKVVEQYATGTEKSFIALIRDPAQGLNSIRKIRDNLTKTPKLKNFKQTSSLYADEDNERFLIALNQSYLQAIKLYRDVLIKNSGASVEFLQKELFIDLKSGSCKQSNRIDFLILSLQAVILSGRTGQLKNITNPDLSAALKTKLGALDNIPLEELSWKWLKDYPTWFSAMYVFLYPENAALPFMYEDLEKYSISLGTDDFKVILDKLLATPQNRYSVFQEIINYYTKHITPEERNDINFQLINGTLTSESILLISKLDNDNKLEKAINVKKFMDATPEYAGYVFYREERSIFLNGLFSPIIFQLHIPIAAGFVLNKSENYESAHEWYQQLYDPTKTGDEKFGFDFNNAFNGSIGLEDDWESGILDPNAILHRRQGAMLRHVVMMMVKNLLDWADHEFAHGTVSSIDRARQLYELAKVTLDAPDLRDHCGQSLRELSVSVLDRFSSKSELIQIIEQLEVIKDQSILEKATADIEAELNKAGTPNVTKIEKIVNKALQKFGANKKPNNVNSHTDNAIKAKTNGEAKLLSRLVKENGPQHITKLFADNVRANSRDGLRANNEYFTSSVITTFCVPPNPLLLQLDRYIKLSLMKFQLCLDISGEPLAPSTISNESAAELFDDLNNQLERQPLVNLPASWFNKPPRYRYAYLVEKARQYTDVAQRIGGALLSAYQSKDSQNFNILNAQHAIEIASSTVDLRNLGLREAQFGLQIAELQLEKAEEQFNEWERRLNAGLLPLENEGLDHLESAAFLHKLSGIVSGILPMAAAVAGGIAAGIPTAGAGAPAGAAAAGAMIPGAGALINSMAAESSIQGNISLTRATFQRRREDWSLQKTLSEFDSKIADVQKSSATNRIDIADLELGLSQLQHNNASEVLSFLENQFSSTQLYEWMISVLSQNYRTLMQISSNVAKLAQRALEFERQESLNIISGDYWSINSPESNNLSEEQKSSGLLGAERLITDLTRLDAYKLSSEVRRQQISKSISFAQVLPNELISLKTSGKVTFNTLMNWFDRDYPGHYHRLIKGIRVTILALTPPTDGIHGSLSNSGESTVVVNDQANNFKPIRAFRQFDERITLDSPFNESGLFVFDYNDPMFLPFEGLGVESQWTLELPKAANRFDFNTLADVILTIDYTSLYSEPYAVEVKDLLGDTDNNDIAIQPRLQMPDSWYHFINDPIAANNDRELALEITEDSLPAHYINKGAARTHHVTVVVLGDFSAVNNTSRRNKFKKAIYVEHTSPTGVITKLPSELPSSPNNTAEQFNTNNFNKDTNSLFLSTRSSTNGSLKLGSTTAVNPIGEWKVVVNDDLGSNLSFGDLVEDMLLIVTTEGDVDWG